MPEKFMNFDSSRSVEGKSTATMSFNLTPPLSIPQDARDVSICVMSASLWNSVPNVHGKVIECKMEIMDNPGGTNFLDGTALPVPYVVLTKNLNFSIPTGLYNTSDLSTVITDGLFSSFAFTVVESQHLTNGIVVGYPQVGHHYAPFRVVQIQQLFCQAAQLLKFKLVPVIGSNYLEINIDWEGSKFDPQILAIDLNAVPWADLGHLSLAGQDPLFMNVAVGGAALNNVSGVYAIASMLRFVRLTFHVGAFSVLRDLCGFESPVTVILNGMTSTDTVILGSVKGTTTPKFDKLQYFMIGCTLASYGIIMNGGLSNCVIARIHIPPNTGTYEQILYEPSNALEFATSGLTHNLSGISSIQFTLMDQNGFPVDSTGDQSWSVLLRISWTA